MFDRQFFNPNHAHISYILIIDLCTINLCMFKEGCICFCLCLQTVGLVSQARPFLFHSADHFQSNMRMVPLQKQKESLKNTQCTKSQWVHRVFNKAETTGPGTSVMIHHRRASLSKQQIDLSLHKAGFVSR